MVAVTQMILGEVMVYISRKSLLLSFTLFAIFLSITGFGYTVWKLGNIEKTATSRTASIEILNDLSQLEQIIYVLHFDKNTKDGNPRKGWVKVRLIRDLSPLAGYKVEQKAKILMSTWSTNWNSVKKSRQSTDLMINAIDSTREAINREVRQLS
ncbi:hypothetical protein [Parashewanella tropica]|uniref:hypothetical protein n=1 Tax=Parashewanella tropica TaxID=2547970 RepID=UPI0014784AB2|nr:hypothetical protein [Parashewanella tropica]